MGIWPLPNSNTPDLIAGMRAELKDIKGTRPAGMNATMSYDASEYIQNSIEVSYPNPDFLQQRYVSCFAVAGLEMLVDSVTYSFYAFQVLLGTTRIN